MVDGVRVMDPGALVHALEEALLRNSVVQEEEALSQKKRFTHADTEGAISRHYSIEQEKKIDSNEES